MGKVKARRKVWRDMAFKKLGTRGLSDVPKKERSDVLRGVMGMKKRIVKNKEPDIVINSLSADYEDKIH